MKGYKQSTPEEREKIRTMLSYGIPAKEVAKFANRSLNFVNLIARGDYEKNLLADRERKAKERERVRDALEKLEEAVVEEAVEQQPVEEAVAADPFGQEALMNRIADGIDYNNALMKGPFGQEGQLNRIAEGIDYSNVLMNRVLNKLQMLLEALGVKQ